MWVAELGDLGALVRRLLALQAAQDSNLRCVRRGGMNTSGVRVGATACRPTSTRPHSSVWLPHRDTVWLPHKDTVLLPHKDTVWLPDKDTVWLPDKDNVLLPHKDIGSQPHLCLWNTKTACFWAENSPKIKNVTKWVAVAPFGAFRA